MKITDIRCAVIGDNPIVRLLTDAGISGYGPVEWTKGYIKPFVERLREGVVGQDPTDVERVMLRIRRQGAFKPFGAAVSAVEIALWDLAGKAAGVPVYKLLGGKVRDRVRVYNGAIRVPMEGFRPEDFAANAKAMKDLPQGFTMVKMAVGFHTGSRTAIPGYHFGENRGIGYHGGYDRGLLTPKGLHHIIDCAHAIRDALGPDMALALDCGPGMMPQDVIRFAKACEPLNLMWIEDSVSGDYSTHTDAQIYRDISRATSTPIHTGEQIYLRQHFRELIENRAVSVVGPDPCDVGGIAELKWIAEYADLHGVLMAPHGIANGLFGLAALVHASAAMPDSYIAFELPWARPDWWFDIVTGFPDPIVKDGFVEVWDGPGLGIEFDVERAKERLSPEDADFFDDSPGPGPTATSNRNRFYADPKPRDLPHPEPRQ